MIKLVDGFKEKLSKGQCVTGPFMKTSDPAFVEAAGYAGFNFVILDLEHGPGNIHLMQNLVRAAQCAGVLPIVRIPGTDETIISKSLDIGAMGVQVPQITCPEDVIKVVKASRFYPAGDRGVCRFVRAAAYSSMDRFKYFENANQNIIIIQLEGLEAVANVNEILKIEGVDVIFIGPYDLSQSVGFPGQVDHPAVEEKMMEIVRHAKDAGKYVGTFVDNIDNALKWKARGVQYISYSVDVGIFVEASRKIVSEVEKG